MLKKQFNYFVMFSTGIFFFVIGCSLLFDRMTPWNWLYYTLVIGVIVVALFRFLNIMLNFTKMKRRFSQIVDIIAWIGIMIFSISEPWLFYFVFPIIMGFWILLHAIVKIIVLYIKMKDKLPGRMHSFIFLIGDLLMAIILIFNPISYRGLINLVLGFYFIIYGGNTLLDVVREIIPKNSGEKLDQKIRLAVPPFLAAIIPPTLMRTILTKDAEDVARDEFDVIKETLQADLGVLVHLAPSGPAMLGHVDLVYRGFVMSYGCYDPHNRRLIGSMGDGVVLIAPKQSYIHNCLANENKILVEFGIKLDEKQKERLNNRLLEVFDGFVDFYSDEQLRLAGSPYKGDCEDYISRVSKTSPSTNFYKYKEGKLKTFFVLSSNCVYFAANILNVIGLNLFDMSGIISPGSYFDFLNKEFKSDKGLVISRKVYTKKNAKAFLS